MVILGPILQRTSLFLVCSFLFCQAASDSCTGMSLVTFLTCWVYYFQTLKRYYINLISSGASVCVMHATIASLGQKEYDLFKGAICKKQNFCFEHSKMTSSTLREEKTMLTLCQICLRVVLCCVVLQR